MENLTTYQVPRCRNWSDTQEIRPIFIQLVPFFDITRKDGCCLAFYFRWKYFVLIDHIFFSVPVFVSNICSLKLNLWPKVGLSSAISIVIFFWNLCLRKYSLLFFAEFELLMFHNNIVEIRNKYYYLDCNLYVLKYFVRDIISFKNIL